MRLSALRTLVPAAPPSRAARDTIFLLVVIGWIVLLLGAYIPGWTTVLAASVLVWRGWLAWNARPLPGWPWRLALTAVAAGLTLSSHRTLLGPEAGVTLIAVLLALKTMELRAQRDAYVVFFLGFFTLLAPLLQSQSLPMALGIAVAVWGLLTALVLAHRPNGTPPLRQAAATAGALMAVGAPIMALLFALFPRLPPLWGIPTDSPLGRSGLSGQMQVGDVARLALDDRVALRVAFPAGAPPRDALYFRGPVLRVFDGRRWRPLHGPDAATGLPAALVQADTRGAFEPGGAAVPYRVTLEPTSRPWLLTLEGTADTPVVTGASAGLEDLRLQPSPDGQWWLNRPITDVLRYEAQAHPAHRVGLDTPRLALQVDRELPPGYNPRTLAWAQALRRDLGEPAPRVLMEALLRHLREGGYRYTLEPGVYGRDTADEFWFDRRAGFCEHIASAFVIALRALDIPARVVTGYQGGERNPLDGLWTVRQSDAHAWAEVWLPGEGWVRVDPTAYVAPDRTAAGERLRPPPGVWAAAIVRVDPALWSRLRAAWDAANQRWNDWILNYGATRQVEWLRRLGIEASGWQDVARVLGGALGLAALLGVAALLLQRPRPDRWHRLLARAAARWARAGVPCPPPLTPARLRAAIEAQAHLPPGVQQAWGAWLGALEAARYDPQHTTDPASPTMPTLSALAQRLRTLPTPAARPEGQRRWRPWAGLLVALAVGLPSPPTPAQPPTRAAAPAPGYGARGDAQALAEAIDRAEGWDDGWARRWLGQARHDARAARFILPPPPAAFKDWAAYRARFVEPRRIAAGVRFWDTHAAALERAQAEYGVPAWVIVGIIGVETLYGRHLGTHRTLDVLATLALDFPAEHPRAEARQAYFREELRAFLRLARIAGIAPDAWRSSYAGAMGLPQFMPSNWLTYAVDFDGDGRIDLAASAADAIGSVARFLHAHGWQRDLPARFDVTPPPPGADPEALLAPDIRPTFTLDEVRARGAQPAPEAEGYRGKLALVALENGDPNQGGTPPTYVLGTGNFYALTRYNPSSYYAMAVLDLGLAVERARRER
ncbi:MAG: transglutaminaseTgpA domain-containing protein [Pseudomonadota bacterium]